MKRHEDLMRQPAQLAAAFGVDVWWKREGLVSFGSLLAVKAGVSFVVTTEGDFDLEFIVRSSGYANPSLALGQNSYAVASWEPDTCNVVNDESFDALDWKDGDATPLRQWQNQLCRALYVLSEDELCVFDADLSPVEHACNIRLSAHERLEEMKRYQEHLRHLEGRICIIGQEKIHANAG